jgi:hypothetical protein
LGSAQVAADASSSLSPAVVPEFYVARARSRADAAECTTWSNAVDQFHIAKPIGDPANGAWSLAQAEFYVAKYGAGGAKVDTRDGSVPGLLCAATTAARP